MRVLFWADLFWPYIGGPECFSAQLLPALRDLNHEFVVITSHHDQDLPNQDSLDGIPIHRFPFRHALEQRDMNLLAQVRNQVAELKRSFAPDLIHMSAFGPSVLFHLMTSGSHPTPSIATVQHQLLSTSKQSRSLLTRIVNEADWVRTVSESVLMQLQQWKPELISRSSVTYSFVEQRSCNRITPVSFDPPVILCLGRLVPVKGFDLAVRMLETMVKEFPDVQMIIAGEGVSRDALQHQVEVAGLSGSVSFLGLVRPELIWEVLDRATLVLIPSRSEGLPTTAIQAALAERPIVAADVGGMSEVVVPGKTGVLVDKENVEALEHAVRALLQCPNHARELATAARRHALEHFSKTHCVARFDELYRQIGHPVGVNNGGE